MLKSIQRRRKTAIDIRCQIIVPSVPVGNVKSKQFGELTSKISFRAIPKVAGILFPKTGQSRASDFRLDGIDKGIIKRNLILLAEPMIGFDSQLHLVVVFGARRFEV